MVRPTITSEKHINQSSQQTLTGPGTIVAVNLATAKHAVDPASANDVPVGATIKAVYVELWILAEGNAIGATTVTVEKLISGSGSMSFGNSSALHNYDNKNNIFYSTQGIMGEANTNPTPFVRQWIKIPKGKQRWSLGDKLVINISAITSDITFCGLYIYKAYT